MPYPKEFDSSDESFLRGWIKGDPELRAQIQQITQHHGSDSRRFYRRSDIDFVNYGAEFAHTHDEIQSTADFINALGGATERFRQSGTLDITGGWAGELVDHIYLTAFRADLPDNINMAEFLENIVGASLQARCQLAFPDYQMGVQIDTYGMDITRTRLQVSYSPQPKNIEP